MIKPLKPVAVACESDKTSYTIYFSNAILDTDKYKEQLSVLTCPKGCGHILKDKSDLSSLIEHWSNHVGSKKFFDCPFEDCQTNRLDSGQKLEEHLQSDHMIPAHCPICEEREDDLLEHIKDHTAVDLFICPAKGCESGYSNKAELQKHISSSHTDFEEKIRYSCNRCAEEEFKSEESARSHITKEHSVRSKYHCAFCSKKDETKKLKEHLQQEHSDSVSNVKRIEALKRKEGEFECPKDDEEFGTKEELVEHFNSEHYMPDISTYHDNSSSYVSEHITCKTCGDGKKYTKSQWQGHVKQPHSGKNKEARRGPTVTTYTCPTCKEDLNNPKEIKNHINLRHPTKFGDHFRVDESFKCPLCILGFREVDELFNHFSEKHDKNLVEYLLKNYDGYEQYNSN